MVDFKFECRIPALINSSKLYYIENQIKMTWVLHYLIVNLKFVFQISNVKMPKSPHWELFSLGQEFALVIPRPIANQASSTLYNGASENDLVSLKNDFRNFYKPIHYNVVKPLLSFFEIDDFKFAANVFLCNNFSYC